MLSLDQLVKLRTELIAVYFEDNNGNINTRTVGTNCRLLGLVVYTVRLLSFGTGIVESFTPQITNTAQLTQTKLSTQLVEFGPQTTEPILDNRSQISVIT